MSAPNKMTGKAPRQRTGLQRERKQMPMRFRMPVYRQLLKLQGDGESLTSVVERLILQARPLDRLCE